MKSGPRKNTKKEQKRALQSKTALHIFIDDEGNVIFSDLPEDMLDIIKELDEENENLTFLMRSRRDSEKNTSK